MMQRLELTLPTPAENLALDEAVLDLAEEEIPGAEFLRIWESPRPMVVMGRSSRVATEINEDACHERDIPVLRRSSGGAAIVAGPGCLMYALVLGYKKRPELKDISRAHACVLDRLAASLRPMLQNVADVTRAGTSDLAFVEAGGPPAPRKFSGNSLRAKRNHLLYHGTLLYDFDLTLIETCLRMPPRQPDYRASRPHTDFVANLPVARQALVEAVDNAWPTTQELINWTAARVADLVAERFGRDGWNREFG